MRRSSLTRPGRWTRCSGHSCARTRIRRCARLVRLGRLFRWPPHRVQRRIADTLGIGAVVMSILSTRGDEILAQSIVLDVWRNYPQSDRTATDADKPQEVLGIIRDVSRALERVSWRTRSDPRRVLVFDLENQTGNDSLGMVARQLSDSLRAMVGKRL